MKEKGVDLLLFAGGDGTARDIHAAVGEEVVVVGIPAGVKIHSAVFGRNPNLAGETAALWVKGAIAGTVLAEVMDINEDDYRQEILSARLYGYLRIPAERKRLQRLKCGSAGKERHAQEAIAHDMAEQLKPDRLYLVGAGSTTRPLMQLLGLESSLLGVDAVKDGRLIGKDLTEKQILKILSNERVSVIVTPIGGQGYVFGRGNLQFSPAVLSKIDKNDIYILATPGKIHGLEGAPLLLDTGDALLDATLSGHYRIITGYHQHVMYRVSV
jgi:predicted polyphosphate/ATP-dependent NAD kinase